MKYAKLLLVLLILAVLLAGCGKVESGADNTVAAQTDVAVSVEEVAEETTESTKPLVDVNEALSNVWDIMDNEYVEEIPILPGLLLDDIEDWMETTEFTEMKLYQRTKWDSVRLGVYEDIAVAQYIMDIDEDLVWNVRMEKSDTHENKTAIVIPEYAQSDEWMNYSPEVPCKWYNWSNEDGTWTEMYIVYFAETKNLYTFYSNQIVYKYTGDTPTYETITYRNSNRCPDVVTYDIENDDISMYDYVNNEEIKATRGNPPVRYFRIKMALQGKATYQYEFGMTLGQWVNSKYNVDGWKFDPKDPYIVTSADGRYKLNKDDYCWREMTAQLHNSAK